MQRNILLILCDQLSALALESYGNTYNQAPNIQSIANSGAVVENAYTTCPLCQPARASLWTSLYPHQTGVLSNLPDQGFDTFPKEIKTMGDMFTEAGYHCVHFGKRHDYGTLRGFECYEEVQLPVEKENDAITYDYETYYDENTTQQVETFLEREANEQPFFAVADLQNPHNICGYIGANEHGHEDFGDDILLPELPINYHKDMSEDRPEFLQYLCCAHRRQSQTKQWNEDDFRHYLYAYHYYISVVDRQVGRILSSLEKSGKKEETLIVFISDHGEGMASHGLVTKYGAFYEETNRIPMFFAGNGVSGGSRIKGIASIIDIFPTLLEYSGLKVPNSLEGISLNDQITGRQTSSYRTYAVGQWYDEFDGYRVPGRMYVDSVFKYTVYNDARYEEKQRMKVIEEELYDLVYDRIEMKNLSNDQTKTSVLSHYREMFEAYALDVKDGFSYMNGQYSGRYRQHLSGCSCHEGPNATLEYAAALKN